MSCITQENRSLPTFKGVYPDSNYDYYTQTYDTYSDATEPYDQYDDVYPSGSETMIKMINIVSIVTKILVVVGIPYALYKFFVTFPLNIINFFINLFHLEFGKLWNQLKSIFDVNKYRESLRWLLGSIVIALSFMGVCHTKQLLGDGFEMGMIIKKLIKKLLPRVFAFLIPFLGQALMVFDVIKCLFV